MTGHLTGRQPDSGVVAELAAARVGTGGEELDQFNHLLKPAGKVRLVPFVVQPLVGGELGLDVEYDRSTHPPGINRVQYVLDYPTTEDLLESFPAYIVSEALAERMTAARLPGFALDDAEVRPGDNYVALYGNVPHKRYRWLRIEPHTPDTDVWLGDELQLCVSDRMMAVLEEAELSAAEIEPL